FSGSTRTLRFSRVRKRNTGRLLLLCSRGTERADWRPLRFEQVPASDDWAPVAGRNALFDARGAAAIPDRSATHALRRPRRNPTARARISSLHTSVHAARPAQARGIKANAIGQHAPRPVE